MADLARLRALLRDTDPAAVVGDRLPLLPPMEKLLGGRLKRGAVVAIEGEAARYSLAMVLLAGVSGAGGWCAVVGVPSFGYVAAAGYGVRLETLGLVPQPGNAWAEVVSALAPGVDALLVHPPEQVSGQLARRLIAKARRSGCTVLTLGSTWAGSDVRVSVASREWQGLGQGTGRLRRCRVTVVASHRPRARLEMWLPADDGHLGLAGTLAGVPSLSASGPRARAG
jgi:hypothetical protein